MHPDELKTLQAPLKERYRTDPAAAQTTIVVFGTLDPERIACRVHRTVDTPEAGLHPLAGGDGTFACSGDMLLESLVACAGVTLCAVATALDIPLGGGTVRADGDLDFRGTLGVDKQTPVGFTSIRLHFDLATDAAPEQLEKLIKLTERYCVIYQTFQHPPQISASAGK
jgi:uncharacterized OsmC-like protein